MSENSKGLAGFTPGSWSVELPNPDFRIVAKDVVIGYVTQDTYPSHRINEAEANANLIAAAPELYEACKAIITDYKNANKSLADALVKCVDAIAKAEGAK